ncbi:F-box/kelch-repeat protein At3g23880-like [Andrographis paniculata]|uniref:F-box/kelch-repeat protein At3g23880-like n=1 Tax=Andrographis paniculata TaxID=175694 RepID=UPI0021E91B69|nr:F-box/kelch-repeat protein At3g23880-like [Andrographis paniculata]
MSDHLPTELIIEILLRVPVKSLIRFTTVCKLWRSLITSPFFVSSHLSNAKDQTLLLRRYDKHDKREHYTILKENENAPLGVDHSSELAIPFKSRVGYFRIVGSCNGLVCLSDDLFATTSGPTIIWNPSIRNHLVVPMPSILPKEPHLVVLGFGVAGNDAKVVRLIYYRKPEDFGFQESPEVEIFSLKERSWRRVSGVDVRLQILEFVWHHAFLNGIVHWLAYKLMDGDGSRSSILSFDICKEEFSEVMLPLELGRELATDLHISLIVGSLGVIKYSKEVGHEWGDVWAMREYGVKESWTKLYRIDMAGGVERVVAFRKNGEALVALKNFELASYDSETGFAKSLGVCGTTRSFYIDRYVESLLLFGEHSAGERRED